MKKRNWFITVIAIIVVLLGMTLIHQSREYENYHSVNTNDGYINVNYFQYVIESDDLISPHTYYYYSYGDIGLLTISLIGIVISLYLLVVKAKEGIFFTSDKLKLLGYILLVLVSISSVILLFSNNPNEGVVQFKFINKLLMLITALVPIGVLFAVNYNKINELKISFLLTILFIASIFYISYLDVFWFILMIEIMGSVVVVSLLLDDVSKLNTNAYSEY